MERRRLNQQADRIEAVLASHRLPVRVDGGVVTPRWVRFQLAIPPGLKIKRLSDLADEIALALGAPTVQVRREGGQVNVEVPRDTGLTVELRALDQRVPAYPPATALLGLDDEGRPVLIRLPSPQVGHVLIAGTTGSGKTALARAMIASLAMHNRPAQLQLALIDPKSRGYRLFDGLPHLLCAPCTRAEQALELLKRLVVEMERRDLEGRCTPRVVLFIDELADLMLVGGKEVEAGLTRLTQRGREAGIHVVACTQKPSAEAVGSLIKANFPVRIVGKVVSADEARLAAGVGGTGAEKLGGRGEFLVIGDGQTVRLQAAWISPDEVRDLVAEIRARREVVRVDSAPRAGESAAVRPVRRVRETLRLIKGGRG